MAYMSKDYSSLIGMQGFSETLLKNHFTLYQGYVTNTNKLTDSLTAMLKDGKTGQPEYSELKRRMGFEFNGMRLHELYFDNLGGNRYWKKPRNSVRKSPRLTGCMKPGKRISKPSARCAVSAGRCSTRTGTASFSTSGLTSMSPGTSPGVPPSW